jgi:hypothetical protein
VANSVTEWIVEAAKGAYAGHGPGVGRRIVREMRAKEKFNPRSNRASDGLHLTELARACFGPAWESRLQRVSARSEWVGEASAEAVDLSVFREITGAVLVEQVEMGYAQAASVANQLVGTWQSSQNPLDEATIPEMASTPDGPLDVAPGAEYPRAGFSSVWYKAPRPSKFGLIAALTLELVKANQKTEFLDAGAEVGRTVGTEEAERKIRVVIGVTNNYNRLGAVTNTYLTSGAYANSLTDFVIANGPKEFDRLLQLAAVQMHPVTGKSIQFTPTAVLTVPGNAFQTRHNLRISEYRQTDGANVTAISQGNPLGMDFPVLQDPAVQRIAALASGGETNGLGLTAAKAKTLTVVADFQRAFKWREEEPFSVFETGDLSNDFWPPSFFQDVVYAVKARSWGAAFVREPRFAYRGYNDAAT